MQYYLQWRMHVFGTMTTLIEVLASTVTSLYADQKAEQVIEWLKFSAPENPVKLQNKRRRRKRFTIDS